MSRFSLCFVLCALASAGDIHLHDGWAIQPAADVHESGESISQPGYKTRECYRARVPSTVFSALVEDHVYPDPYFGMNLRSAVSYPVGMNFSNVEMPPDSPFRHSWWYRTEFKLPASYRDKTIWLDFDGINFR